MTILVLICCSALTSPYQRWMCLSVEERTLWCVRLSKAFIAQRLIRELWVYIWSPYKPEIWANAQRSPVHYLPNWNGTGPSCYTTWRSPNVCTSSVSTTGHGKPTPWHWKEEVSSKMQGPATSLCKDYSCTPHLQGKRSFRPMCLKRLPQLRGSFGPSDGSFAADVLLKRDKPGATVNQQFLPSHRGGHKHVVSFTRVQPTACKQTWLDSFGNDCGRRCVMSHMTIIELFKYVRNSLRIKSCLLQEGRGYLGWKSSRPTRRFASGCAAVDTQSVSRGAWWLGSYDVNMTYVTTCKTWLIIAFSANSFTWPPPPPSDHCMIFHTSLSNPYIR